MSFCFWENVIHIALIFPMILIFSYISFWLNIDYYLFEILPSDKQINVLLYHRTAVVKFVCYSNTSYFYFLLKTRSFLSELPGTSHEEVFLLNRLNLLNFNKCMYVYVCVCVYVSLSIYIVCMCMYVCMYIYIYM